MVQYLSSMWHGGRTRCRELRTIAECLGALERSELPHLGDLLTQLFKSPQLQAAEGNDEVARFLELIPCYCSSVASELEACPAQKERLASLKVAALTKSYGAKPF